MVSSWIGDPSSLPLNGADIADGDGVAGVGNLGLRLREMGRKGGIGLWTYECWYLKFGSNIGLGWIQAKST